MSLDLKLFYFLNNLAGRSQIFDAFVVFCAAYLQYVLVVVFILLLIFFRCSKKEKWFVFWTTVLSAGLARLGVVELIRFLYHRPRPFMAHRVNQLLIDNAWSFPSGHSAFFFAMATIIFLRDKKWGAGFFVAAILMNVSRIIAGIHYPSDILGGMVVGVVTALFVFFAGRKFCKSAK